MIDEYPCHCGRPRACKTCTEEQATMWFDAFRSGDDYWLYMASSVCQECWDSRCDTGGAPCM